MPSPAFGASRGGNEPGRLDCDGLGTIPSADAKRDSVDEIASKTVLEAIEDFPLPIAHDLVQPDAVVDRYEESSATPAGRTGVGGDVGIEEVIPGFEDFGFTAAQIEIKAGEHLGHDNRT